MEATAQIVQQGFPACALATDFKQHGASAIAKVRQQQPATYMKICALLVPRELQVEHKTGVKGMSDEQLEQGIEAIKAMLAARAADLPGNSAVVIEGHVGPIPPALPKPKRKAERVRKVRKTEGDMVVSMGKDEKQGGYLNDIVGTMRVRSVVSPVPTAW